jgi:hypothetical protein
MTRRFDLRRLPLGLVFLASSVAVLLWILKGNWWLVRDRPLQFLRATLLLVPVAAFFGAMMTLVLWYVLRVVLPGILRARRLSMIRYQRALRRTHEDLE